MYGTVQEVRQMLKSDIVNSIIGDEYISDEVEREQKLLPLIEHALGDAAAEVDGYLAKRYPVPLTNAPPVVHKYAKDIAVYNLVSRIGVVDKEREDNYRERYKFALKFLESVSRGVVDLGLKPPNKQAATGFQMHSPNRIFSRDSMKGM